MIAITGLSFSYPVPRRYREILLHPFARPGAIPALNDLSLKIAPGERLAVLGRNGAGKTTLLKLIGGLLFPSAGEISVLGLDVVRHNSAVRRVVGYVINEERSFYWRLTGAQNLEFFAALHDLHGAAARRRIATLLEQVGLVAAADTRVSDYSAGMRQRLALARGLLANPKVLLLDEPTKSLDPIGADVIRDVIMNSADRSADRILAITTNQFDDVVTLCDRVCIINEHRLAADHSVSRDIGQVRTLVQRVLTNGNTSPHYAKTARVR